MLILVPLKKEGKILTYASDLPLHQDSLSQQSNFPLNLNKNDKFKGFSNNRLHLVRNYEE